jgi:hypothetical protein
LQVGDTSTVGTLGPGNINIASGATLNYFVKAGASTLYTTNNTITGTGTLQKTGTGTLNWGTGAATFAMSGGLIDVQAGTFVGSSNANENWTSNKSSLNIASGANFSGVEGVIYVDALTGSGTLMSGNGVATPNIIVGVNGTAAGTATFSGVIADQTGASTGPANITKTGSGTQILTGTNTYTGTTTISGGTLQVGASSTSGTTGTLGTGAVTLSGGSTLSYQRAANTTINNVITGTGNVIANITGTLGIGSGGISLTGTSSFTPSISLTSTGAMTQTGALGISNASSTNTSISLTTTAAGSGITLGTITGSNSGTGVVNVAVESNGGTVAANGLISANNISLDNTNGSIDATTGVITRGNAVVTTGRGVSASALNANNNINIAGFGGNSSNNEGVLLSNSTQGIRAGNAINVYGSSAGNNGIYTDNQSITSVNGDVSLTGETSTTTTQFGGVRVFSTTVTGKNITVKADSTGTTGNSLGYWGVSSNLDATAQLKITGTSLSNGTGNGVYQFGGRLSSGTGMTITGTSQANNSAVGLVNNMTITNGSSGGISITGTGKDGQLAIQMDGSTSNMTNGGGDVVLSALKGNVGLSGTLTNTSTGGAVKIQAGNGVVTDSGAIDGTSLTINQNSNGGVQVLTSGNGNVTPPTINNIGNGDVVIAAGTGFTAGNGLSANITAPTGAASPALNPVINNGTGKVYLYSGSTTATGNLSVLNAGFNNLYLAGSGIAPNAQLNTPYSVGGTVTGSTSNTQVMFRDATAPTYNLTLANLSKVYGTSDPTLTTSALQSAYTAAGGSTNITGMLGNNSYAMLASQAIASLSVSSATRAQVGTSAGEIVNPTGSGNTYSGIAGASLNISQPSLVITPKTLTVTANAISSTYDGTSSYNSLAGYSTSGLVSSVNGFITGDAVNSVASAFSNSGGSILSSGIAQSGSLTQTVSLATGTGLGNYNINYVGAAGNVAKANLTFTGNSTNSVVYSGNTQTNTYSVSTNSGIVNSTNALGTDVLNVSGMATGRNVVTGGVADNLSVTGSAATLANYTISTTNGKLLITPATLTINAVSDSKTYNGSTASSGVATYSTSAGNGLLLGTDTLTGVTQTFASKNVLGTNSSTLGIANYTVNDGNSGNNYAVTTNTALGSITAKALTATLVGPVSKTYDGGTTATIGTGNIALSGVVSGDSVNVANTTGVVGTYASANVLDNLSGSGSVTAINLSSSNLNAGTNTLLSNYVLSGASSSITANVGTITPAPVVISGITAANKVYDGTTLATLNTSGMVTAGVVSGQAINTSATGAFDSPSVGNGKTVNLSLVNTAGANTNLTNYNISNQSSTTADITAAPIPPAPPTPPIPPAPPTPPVPPAPPTPPVPPVAPTSPSNDVNPVSPLILPSSVVSGSRSSSLGVSFSAASLDEPDLCSNQKPCNCDATDTAGVEVCYSIDINKGKSKMQLSKLVNGR